MPVLSVVLCILGSLSGCQATHPDSFEPVKLDDPGVEGNYYQVGDYLLAGQPSAEALDRFRSDGIRTVINLRKPEELPDFDEKAAVESLGMTYVQIPVDKQKMTDATVDEFLEALKGAQKPAVIHCRTAGRVSGLWAVYLALEKGVPPERAIALAEKSGLKPDSVKEFVEDYLRRKAIPTSKEAGPES